MANVPALPVGNRPFWDLDNAEEENIRPISESCVLIQSLKQSREHWLLHAFPKFSTKTRSNKGGVSEITPPPHTIQARGTCDLDIGPHIFPDTSFYEVHYLHPQPQPQYAPVTTTSAVTRNPYWHTTTPYQTHVPTASPAPPTPREPDNVSTPLISSLTSVTTITPSLISQVNSAASTNPTLSNLLQLAASGRATPDQLKTLGLLIQSLASLDQGQTAVTQIQPQPPVPSPSLPAPAPVPPVKEFDIVLEFKESPNERWTFPRAPAFFESTQGEGSQQDIRITTCVPFDVHPKPEHINEVQKQPITFRLKGAPPFVLDTLNRWIGGSMKMEEFKSQIQSIKIQERLFLGYQIPAGSLLSQLQAATAPQYAMKPLRQGPAPPPRKRTAPQRKPAGEAPSVSRKEKPTSSTANSEPANKRSKMSRAVNAPPIQCHSCNKTDVPLIMGGRFCRPCVNDGAANRGAPQPPPYTPIHTTQPASAEPLMVTPTSIPTAISNPETPSTV
ncbi:hypothetical protein BJ165DRAFT_1434817 [Panaeolus papilionaceus]|nr:hypothetical protein BJ165DRAFT_1434817 [Panaeolus papilionaceus]